MAGTLRGGFERLGSSPFAAVRFRLADIDSALVSIFLLDSESVSQPPVWRGPDAPPAPQPKRELSGRVFDRTLRSEALEETRRLTIYLPPGHRSGGDHAAVFLADGGSVNYYAYLVEPLIDQGALPPLVMIGANSGQEGIVEDRSSLGGDIRGLDYLPGFQGDAERFPRHMRFFSEELTALAVREYGVTRDPARRVVAGQSNGGAFAFWAAYQHPDVFGNAIVSSQAYRPVEDIALTPTRARFYMNAGLYEQPMLRTTRRTAAALRAHGFEVVFDELPAGHAPDQTEVMLLDRLQRIFSPAPSARRDR
jgi:enterochelin esterase-like enzyme